MEAKKFGHRNPDPVAGAIIRLGRKALGISQSKVGAAAARNWSTIANGESGRQRLGKPTEMAVLRFYLQEFRGRGLAADEPAADASLEELRLGVAKVLLLLQQADLVSQSVGLESATRGVALGADDFVQRVAEAGLRRAVPAVTARLLERIAEVQETRAAGVE